MEMKTVIVTGGNSGIGKAVAIELAKQQWKVIIMSRNELKGNIALREIEEQSGSKLISLIKGDLSSIAGCRKAAEIIIRKYPDTNVLINNAGVWQTHLELTEDGLERSFMINHMAPFILSNMLLDTLKRNAPSRIINVNAGLYFKGKLQLDKTPYGRDFGKLTSYPNSKLCNVLFTKELAKRIEGTGVSVNAVHPGVIRTNLGNSPGLFGHLLKVIKLFWKSPAYGAIAPVWLASSPEAEGINGKYFLLKKQIDFFDNAQDDELQCRLWEMSERIMQNQNTVH